MRFGGAVVVVALAGVIYNHRLLGVLAADLTSSEHVRRLVDAHAWLVVTDEGPLIRAVFTLVLLLPLLDPLFPLVELATCLIRFHHLHFAET